MKKMHNSASKITSSLHLYGQTDYSFSKWETRIKWNKCIYPSTNEYWVRNFSIQLILDTGSHSYLTLWSPVLDPPIMESHSAQWTVASTSCWKNRAKQIQYSRKLGIILFFCRKPFFFKLQSRHIWLIEECMGITLY